MQEKMCPLEENKICDDCLECNTCDLDTEKMCDNCARCIDDTTPYRSTDISEIIYVGGIKRKSRLIDSKKVKRNAADI